MKTVSAKPQEIQRDWFVVDAENLVLGRLATEVAKILRGKHKPIYTPHVDCGDNVIIINADKVALTGKKLTDKKYFWHTGYPGGIKERTPEAIFRGKHPQRVVEQAVKRMISRNKLGTQMMRKLHVYAGAEHPHTAQQPKTLDIASQNRKNVKAA